MRLLENYEIGHLATRIGKGNMMEWRKLLKKPSDLVDQGPNKATAWQSVTIEASANCFLTVRPGRNVRYNGSPPTSVSTHDENVIPDAL